MIPYYAYKRYKKNQALKEAALDKNDEQFLTQIVEQPPPTPEPSTPATTVDSLFEESKVDWDKEREKKSEPWGQTLKRWGTFGRTSSSNSISKKDRASPAPSSSLPGTPGEPSKPPAEEPSVAATDPVTPEPELTKEQRDLAEVLDSLDMQAGQQGIAFTTPDTRALLQQFTQIIKDIITGVPTAYNDLIEFLETSSTQLSKEWNSLPSSFQKLIRSLPLGIPPDVFTAMTAAAAVPAATGEQAANESAPKAPAGLGSKLNPMSMFTKTNPKTGAKSHTLPRPGQVKDLLGTGGGIATILRSIVTFLKTRFPMLAGTNALMSMGISILMLLLWYCYKRGKEVRLQKEAEAAKLEGKDEPGLVKDTPDGGPSLNQDFKETSTH
ncbi:Pc13g14100 [Rhizoctonia solani]|uniref:Pc13g14100 n=1 Tax=Rhizoctonia solani TaxID=456999 RepID=A0A0K6FKH6_9AGAM|nr:Pc13g14100 [Rhizoctonia solani]